MIYNLLLDEAPLEPVPMPDVNSFMVPTGGWMVLVTIGALAIFVILIVVAVIIATVVKSKKKKANENA